MKHGKRFRGMHAIALLILLASASLQANVDPKMGRITAIQENRRPIPERIRLVAVQGKGSLILYLVFIARSGDFDGLRPTFDRILRSFRVR
jgi:hypothetical protein